MLSQKSTMIDKLENMHLQERINYGYGKVISMMLISGLFSIVVIGVLFANMLHYIDDVNAADQAVKAKLTEGQMSMDFNIMTRLDASKAKVRIADRTFTTFGSRGGVVFVISGAWQLGDKLLTTDQGACWYAGRHTLRLLHPQGKLLFSEINWLAGYSPDQVQ